VFSTGVSRRTVRDPQTALAPHSHPAASRAPLQALRELRPVRKDDFAALAGEDENFAALDVGDDPIYEEIFAE
jgi:hypothetical protein